MKATPTPKPGGVPMKASPNFRNKKEQPLPPGAMQRSVSGRASGQAKTPAVKPKAKPLPMPKARTSSPKRSTAPGKAPTSVPAGAVLGYVKRDTAAANAWVKKHPKKAAAESRRNTV